AVTRVELSVFESSGVESHRIQKRPLEWFKSTPEAFWILASTGVHERFYEFVKRGLWVQIPFSAPARAGPPAGSGWSQPKILRSAKPPRNQNARRRTAPPFSKPQVLTILNKHR